jgi:hypothetical protein
VDAKYKAGLEDSATIHHRWVSEMSSREVQLDEESWAKIIDYTTLVLISGLTLEAGSS